MHSAPLRETHPVLLIRYSSRVRYERNGSREKRKPAKTKRETGIGIKRMEKIDCKKKEMTQFYSSSAYKIYASRDIHNYHTRLRTPVGTEHSLYFVRCSEACKDYTPTHTHEHIHTHTNT